MLVKPATAKANLDEMLAMSMPDPALIRNLALETSTDPDSIDKRFQYAYLLCRSETQADRTFGAGMMEELVKQGYPHDLDCEYSRAISFYISQLYPEARKIAELVLRTKPDDERWRQLHLACVCVADEREKVTNAVIGGGAIAVGVGLLVGLGGVLFGGGKR